MATTSPYLDPSLPVDERVADLVSRMTLPEKVGQMLQLNAKDGHLRRDVVEWGVGSILHASPEHLALAHELVQETRLKIPLLVGEDCIHGHSFWEGATIFPTQLGMAATWDPEILEKVARITAVEVAPTGIHWTFSPVLCIARDLRWGRVNETFGEDPYLLGELGAAMVRGYQGAGLNDPDAILATAKHYAAYSETIGGRDASEADVSQRKMRSWFLPPFERVAREGAATFMLGYQSTDGVPITVNEWLLNEVLRGEWGYEGMLITDWDNVGHLVRETKIYPDFTQASAAAVNAGNDMIMTTPQFFEAAQEAVNQGLLDEKAIDAAVGRILAVKFRLGLFENPRLPDPQRQKEVIACPEHTEYNRHVARRSLVLLENNGLLPLISPVETKPAARKIAVVGPNADDSDVMLGDWAGSSGQADWLMHGHPREQISTVVDGLRAQVPSDWEVTYTQGAQIAELVPDPAGEFFDDGQPRPQIASPIPADPAEIEAAVTAAQEADVTVVVVGDMIHLIGEGRSIATLELVGGQIALVDAIAATGKPFVVVVVASKPLVLPESAYQADAIIWAANPGMEGGHAIAELLLGQIEPTGRLPISWPRHVGQQPVFYNVVNGQHGTRYADLTQSPAWAFGEGRSYTTVEYSNLEILTPTVAGPSIKGPALGALVAGKPEQLDLAALEIPATGTAGLGADQGAALEQISGGVVKATVQVSNTGSRPALEVVQAYVRDLVASATWADKELKAHELVELQPGETKTVELSIPAAALSIVNAGGERVVEPGEFDLLVGPSSRDEVLLAARFEVQ